MSLKYLIILIACLLVALLTFTPINRTIMVETGNEFDIAIEGRGFFEIIDPESGSLRYTRNGHLYADSSGVLSMDIDERKWSLNPPIQLPSEWEKIQISDDGRVQVAGRSKLWIDIGMISVGTFPQSLPFNDPLVANQKTNQTGEFQPKVLTTENGIRQGWVEQRYRNLKQIVLNFTLAILASIVINWMTDYRRTRK